jgi:hypothetical protein
MKCQEISGAMRIDINVCTIPNILMVVKFCVITLLSSRWALPMVAGTHHLLKSAV